MARIEQISDDDVEMVDTAEQEGSWDEDYHDAPSDIQPEPGPFQVPFGVQVPSVRNPETYDIFPAEFRVRAIRKQVEEKGVSYCITQFEDGHVAKVSNKPGVGGDLFR